MQLLKEADEILLNQQWLDRLLAHPFNILQYYQVPPNSQGISIPEWLKTQFQQFGSVYQEQKNQKKIVTR
jgi:hypothetical protein